MTGPASTRATSFKPSWIEAGPVPAGRITGWPPRKNLLGLFAEWPRQYGDRRLLPARASQVPDRMPGKLVTGGAGDSGGCLHHQKAVPANKTCGRVETPRNVAPVPGFPLRQGVGAP